MRNEITVRISTNDNDAFADDPLQELGRILRETADKLEGGNTDFRINDINGNACGNVDNWDC
jgi:hypothetical protein